MSTTNTDEIDLKELLQKFIIVTKRRFFLFLMLFAAFLFASYYFVIRQKEVYFSSYVFFINSDEKKDLYSVTFDLCENLSQHIENGSTEYLSSQLNTSITVLQSIVELNVVDFMARNNSNYIPSAIRLEIFHYNDSHARELASAILQYLNKNDFLKSKQDFQNEKDANILKSAKLDALYVSNLLESEKSKLLDIEDIGSLLDLKFKLSNNIHLYESKLKQKDPFYMVSDSNSGKLKSSKIASFVKSIPLAFIVAILIIVIIEFINLLKSINDHQNQSTNTL